MNQQFKSPQNTLIEQSFLLSILIQQTILKDCWLDLLMTSYRLYRAYTLCACTSSNSLQLYNIIGSENSL